MESTRIFNMDACSVKAHQKLRPFKGTAFGPSRALLWTASWVAYHRHPQLGLAPQLEHLLKHHSERASSLGAFVTAEDVPFEPLLRHLMNLCSLPHPEEKELQVDKATAFYQQLEGGFEQLRKRELKFAERRALAAFNHDAVRCIVVNQADAANLPEEGRVTLASPRKCFTFNSFKAKAFRPYLRQARSLKLYGDMGVQEDPDALTLAAVTQSVAEEYSECPEEQLPLKPDVNVLNACVAGFHSLRSSDMKGWPPMKFFYLDQDGRIEDVSALVPWLKFLNRHRPRIGVCT